MVCRSDLQTPACLHPGMLISLLTLAVLSSSIMLQISCITPAAARPSKTGMFGSAETCLLRRASAQLRGKARRLLGQGHSAARTAFCGPLL